MSRSSFLVEVLVERRKHRPSLNAVQPMPGEAGIEPNAAPKHPVLEHYFENVVSLHSYIKACLPSPQGDCLLDEAIDAPSYARLLFNTRVAWTSAQGAPRKTPTVDPDLSTLEDLVRRVQRDLLSGSVKSDNVLCYGYAMVDHLFWYRYSTTLT